jgi:hypothetical protein
LPIKNIIILYNPYYQENVIEQHLDILKQNGAVAFGKVKSKLNDTQHPNEQQLEHIYSEVSKETPLQLFLTDYNSIFVANVIAVKTEKTKLIKAPAYYDALDVEQWYVFDDLRLIVQNNFQLIRDRVLSNFKAVNYNDRTYAVYGNPYVYPMEVTMKEEINYFEKEDANFKYYNNIFKSELELQTKESLINFTYGTHIFYSFAPNTQDNIIASEIEYLQNKHNPLYDFSSVVIKYSKAVELELHRFMKVVFAYLIEKEPSLANLPYSIQGRDYTLSDIQEHKANYGTYKFLIKSYKVKDALNRHISKSSDRYFISATIPHFINIMQSIRNESVHGGATSFQECREIRDAMLGIGKNSFLGELVVNKEHF